MGNSLERPNHLVDVLLEGNLEHNANSLFWAMDNRIYTAEHEQYFQWKNGRIEVKKTLYRGQWGRINLQCLFVVTFNDQHAPERLEVIAFDPAAVVAKRSRMLVAWDYAIGRRHLQC